MVAVVSSDRVSDGVAHLSLIDRHVIESYRIGWDAVWECRILWDGMGWDERGWKCFGLLYCSEVRCGMTWCNAA